MLEFSLLHWLAFLYFLVIWIGYTLYVKHRAKNTVCLASVLHDYRIAWMRNIISHENRIADFALLDNLMRSVNFFASTTIFLLAGLVTIFYSADNIVEIFSHYSFIAQTTTEEVQFKLLVLIVIFIFAFFRFTWAMRQYSFIAVLLGAAPHSPKDKALSEEQAEFVTDIAKITDLAGHEYNYGLRAYYFAMATIAWFINSWIFMLACTFVVMILYRREFKSRTLYALAKSREDFQKTLNTAADDKK